MISALDPVTGGTRILGGAPSSAGGLANVLRVRLSWNAAFTHHFTRRSRCLMLGMGDGGALAA